MTARQDSTEHYCIQWFIRPTIQTNTMCGNGIFGKLLPLESCYKL